MILIIGYGSILRGDDGVGQHIARRLDISLYGETVEVLSCHQLTPELVESVSKADLVIFIDAAEDGEPGKIRRYVIEPEISSGAFTHNVSPADLLAAARDLYGTHPQGVMLSITGVCFDYGEELSEEVEAAVPVVIQQIRRLIEAKEPRVAGLGKKVPHRVHN